MLWIKEQLGEAHALQIAVVAISSVVATLLSLAVVLGLFAALRWSDSFWHEPGRWSIGRAFNGCAAGGIFIAVGAIAIFFIWNIAAVVWREAF
jgi:hypothetical protein